MPESSGIFGNIRIKIFVGFSVVLMAVIVAAIINFVALNRMSTSLSVLSEPDKKIGNVRVLLVHLSNEETSARYYSLTGDSQYLKMYHALSDSVHYRLAVLKTLILNDDRQMELADSVTQLAAEREAVLNDFIANRKVALASLVVKPSAPRKPVHIPAAPKKQPVALTVDQSTAPAVATIDSARQINQSSDEGKSIFGWVKNIFSSKEKKEKKKEEAPVVNETRVSRDTSSLPVSLSAAEPLNSPEEKNHEAEIASLEQMKSWSNDELALLQRNQEIMDRIRDNVSVLEQNENTIKEQHAAEAKQKAADASEMISIVSVLGLLLSLIFVTLIFRDINNSNRLRTQLESERKRAEKLAKVKEDFLANMSHEIRTPLNAIIGYSELLAKDLRPETKEEFVGAIQKSSGHLLTLVNQILDFSKLEAGKQQPENVTFNFHDLVSDVYETFRLQAAEKNLEFSYDVNENIPSMLNGDALSMRQILINLVSNAIKFTSSGGVSIHAELERERSNSCRIKTEISDTGIGIAEDGKEKIFSPFTQSNSDITRKFGGTGLGLAITRRLTESLGGKIELVSEEGKGSTFTVSVPFSKIAAGTHASAGGSMETKNIDPAIKGKSVLIVDDEEMNVKLCKVILESWGLVTDEASNGKEAMEKISQKHFDLMLLDIQMPEMSGLEVVKAIRSTDNEDKNQLPIIALTANVFGNENDEYLLAGFSGQLIKPFREQQLYAELRRHLLKVNVSAEQEIKSEEQSLVSDKPYSLRYLEKTSGTDKQFIESMLQTFIQNNKTHLGLFHEAIEREDYESIHNLAHKMIPSFRYLEMKNMESKLRELEAITKNNDHPEMVPKLVNEIIIETENLLPLLSQEIQMMHSENSLPVPDQITSPIET